MRIDIEVLSPVHVGTGETAGPLEYLVDGDFRLVDLSHLFARNPTRAEAIGQRLAAASPSALHIMRLEELLTGEELADPALWRYRIAGDPASLHALRTASGPNREVRLAIKRSDGLAYLPGTAIKGALRTALIYAWSAGDSAWARQFLSVRPREGHASIQAILFGARRDPTHDVLRAVVVGDTSGVPPGEALHLVQEQVLSANIRANGTRGPRPDEYKRFQVYLEALRPGTTLSLRGQISRSILVDERAARVLGWVERQRDLTIPGLCAAMNRMASDVCRWELDYLSKITGADCRGVTAFYRDLQARVEAAQAEMAYLCVGRGAGWHKMTAGMRLVAALQPSEFRAFRQQHNLAAWDRRDRLDFIFPKTRKCVTEGFRAIAPLGWIRMRWVEAP